MNKATERLKEIEEALKVLKFDTYGIASKIVEAEKQGILLGIEETKREYEQRNCENHALYKIYCDKCFKDLKKELLEKLKKRIRHICIGCQDCNNEFNSACDIADHARIYEKFVKWQSIEEELK